MSGALAVRLPIGAARPGYREPWRPAFRGYQRMRIVNLAGAEYQVEAEEDGTIAVGFKGWVEADNFIRDIQEAQRAPFMEGLR